MIFCKFCEKHGEYLIEDEYHFPMICPLYENLRKKYIPKSFILYPSGENLKKLLQNNNEFVIKNVAMYLYFADHLRQHKLATY